MIFVDCTKKTMMCIDDKENHLWWCPSHIGLQLQRLVHAQFPHLPARSFPRLPLHFAPHPARQQVSLRSLTWCLEGPSWLVGRDAYTVLNIYIYPSLSNSWGVHPASTLIWCNKELYLPHKKWMCPRKIAAFLGSWDIQPGDHLSQSTSECSASQEALGPCYQSTRHGDTVQVISEKFGDPSA